jgi:hypothetical protein
VIGTRQYRRMENDSTNIRKDEKSVDVVAAGETRERETNAPHQFKAPRAAEEREANAPCQRKTAEDMGTREANVSEKEATAVRRDGGPLTIADRQLRQEDHQAEPRRKRLRKLLHRQLTRILVRGRRPEDADPT